MENLKVGLGRLDRGQNQYIQSAPRTLIDGRLFALLRTLHLLHHGMVIVGTPYSEKRLLAMNEITGGSPYGAGSITGADGARQPSENELGQPA